MRPLITLIASGVFDMSRLEYFTRPLVAFDVEDQDHRAFFHEYLIRKTWGRCPVRFICPDEHGPEGLVGIVMRQLVAYYARQEFGDEPKTDGLTAPVHKPRKPKGVAIDLKVLANKVVDKEPVNL